MNTEEMKNMLNKVIEERDEIVEEKDDLKSKLEKAEDNLAYSKKKSERAIDLVKKIEYIVGKKLEYFSVSDEVEIMRALDKVYTPSCPNPGNVVKWPEESTIEKVNNNGTKKKEYRLGDDRV